MTGFQVLFYFIIFSFFFRFSEHETMRLSDVITSSRFGLGHTISRQFRFDHLPLNVFLIVDYSIIKLKLSICSFNHERKQYFHQHLNQCVLILELLFDNTCINQLQELRNVSGDSNTQITETLNDNEVHILRNTTIESIINELMMDHWKPIIEYEKYNDICASTSYTS